MEDIIPYLPGGLLALAAAAFIGGIALKVARWLLAVALVLGSGFAVWYLFLNETTTFIRFSLPGFLAMGGIIITIISLAAKLARKWLLALTGIATTLVGIVLPSAGTYGIFGVGVILLLLGLFVVKKDWMILAGVILLIVGTLWQ